MEEHPSGPARPLRPAPQIVLLLCPPHAPQAGPLGTRPCISRILTTARRLRHNSHACCAALSFNLERLIDERVQKYFVLNLFIFLPFNAGPRICLGKQVHRHISLQLTTTPHILPSPQPSPHQSSFSHQAAGTFLLSRSLHTTRSCSCPPASCSPSRPSRSIRPRARLRYTRPASSGARMRSTGASGCGCGAI